MKRWLTLLLLAGFAGALVRGAADEGLRASKPEVRKAVIAVIEAQLAAFRGGDFNKAYSFAAAELRAQKPIQLFMSIVRSSYPEIWTNRRAECGVVRDNGTLARLLVTVSGQDGEATYDYTLVRERAGWRIRDVLRHEPKKAQKV
ncbi:MAG: DUF4864 domain-containing protein [Verrucomicrobia bacterium]|nr:DUF4864 domain-containing protein [Verrucomicrobiota bacterium]